jgi:hypothetical protein
LTPCPVDMFLRDTPEGAGQGRDILQIAETWFSKQRQALGSLGKAVRKRMREVVRYLNVKSQLLKNYEKAQGSEL